MRILDEVSETSELLPRPGGSCPGASVNEKPKWNTFFCRRQLVLEDLRKLVWVKTPAPPMDTPKDFQLDSTKWGYTIPKQAPNVFTHSQRVLIF